MRVDLLYAIRLLALGGVIAVLVLDDVTHAVPVASALLEGGIDAMELTLRTPVAVDLRKSSTCLQPMTRMIALNY